MLLNMIWRACKYKKLVDYYWNCDASEDSRQYPASYRLLHDGLIQAVQEFITRVSPFLKGAINHFIITISETGESA